MSPADSHRDEACTRSARADDAGTTLVFDRDAIRAVDRAAIEEYGIPGIVLMENAARGLARHTLEMLGDDRAGARVLICCGGGNNGGDGYALARHLHNRRVVPVLAALKPPASGTDAATNAAICACMGLEQIGPAGLDGLPEHDLIVDAILGTGLDRPVQGDPAAWIEWINGRGERVLAVDVPSGLDCNTGEVLGCAVRAERTATFAGLKAGFLEPGAQSLLGEVFIVDIGVPRALAERLGREA